MNTLHDPRRGKMLRTVTAILALGGLVGVGALLSACPGEDTAAGPPDTGTPPIATTPTPTTTGTTTPDGGPPSKTSCLDRPPGSAPLPRTTDGLPCELIPPGLVLTRSVTPDGGR